MVRYLVILSVLVILFFSLPAWGGEGERAMQLFEEGVTAYERGDLFTAKAKWEEALRIRKKLGLLETKEAANTLNNLGVVASNLSQYEEAKGYFEEALKTFRKLGLLETEVAATILNNLGNVASNLSQYEEAKGYFEEA
nr:tetratricopeptide repeat protein [Candidatus Calescibacterium sp.]